MTALIIIITLLIFFAALSIIYIYKFVKIKHQYQILDQRRISFVHKLRTPLGTIQTGAVGIKHYLPMLIALYKQVYNEQLTNIEITPLHLELLTEALTNIEIAIQAANQSLQEFS
jgi:hypothetical protein